MRTLSLKNISRRILILVLILTLTLILTAYQGNVLIPLSARRPQQLLQKARDLLTYLQQPELAPDTHLDLAAIAYTLQNGREAMAFRCGIYRVQHRQFTHRVDTIYRQRKYPISGKPALILTHWRM